MSTSEESYELDVRNPVLVLACEADGGRTLYMHPQAASVALVAMLLDAAARVMNQDRHGGGDALMLARAREHLHVVTQRLDQHAAALELLSDNTTKEGTDG